jgi:hypothetical protein
MRLGAWLVSDDRTTATHSASLFQISLAQVRSLPDAFAALECATTSVLHTRRDIAVLAKLLVLLVLKPKAMGCKR